MTQEEKQLLFKDLFARLPYGIKCKDQYGDYINVNIYNAHIEHLIDQIVSGIVQMVLRPMSNMTDEEIVELKWLNEKCDAMPTFEYVPVENYRIYDWMNRHHFDFRSLIEKGLALEAPSDMYNIKEK